MIKEGFPVDPHSLGLELGLTAHNTLKRDKGSMETPFPTSMSVRSDVSVPVLQYIWTQKAIHIKHIHG